MEKGLSKQFLDQCGQAASRQSFSETILARRHRAEQSAREAERLSRLCELLDKHPEVGEILELVRDLGV